MCVVLSSVLMRCAFAGTARVKITMSEQVTLFV